MTIIRKHYILFLMFFSGLGGTLYGYDIGVISGAMLFMHKDILLSVMQTSLIVGSVLGGGSLATLIAGFLADYFGRKRIILLSGIIFILGVLILVNAHTFYTVLIGRLVQGIGIGIVIVVIPLYVSETVPARLRGRTMTLFQLFLTFGILLAYIVNIAFVETQNWRGMFYCVLAPGILFTLCVIVISESPRWLYRHKQYSHCKQSLLRTHTEAETEDCLKQLENNLHADASNKGSDSIWQRRYMLPLLLALSIACLNQFTGINTLLQYGTLILQRSGIHSNIGAMLGSVGVGLTNFIVTIVALFLIDRLGRKPLLIVGTAGTVCALLFLGLTPYLPLTSLAHGYLTLMGFIGFIVFFAIGPGVVVWLAISELIPNRIRSKGMAICLFANSACSAVLASSFLIIVKYIHLSGAFLMCAILTFIYFLIARFWLPETKNQTLEEIERHFIK